ncbi:MAG: bifunctional 5,10-methylenetetrahydrofolate dehydrogenase/5,10-methenyltetrahydrofolate cyclohydrolase [Chitinophagales bacterium]
MTLILDGKKLSSLIKEEIAHEIMAIRSAGGNIPHLAAVLVGTDGASETYVKSKVSACNKVGMQSTLIRLDADTSQEKLLKVIEELNANEDIDGFIVQLPLPKHIDEQAVTLAIKPEKDVDGFHPQNVGRIQLGLPAFISATPMGIMTILERYNIETSGKHCVVIGRSNIVGTPISILLSRNSNPGNCTVTICHSRTINMKEITLQADIIIAALGKAEFVTADMVKPGAVVIDVGITRLIANNEKGYVIKGDVAYDSVAPKCSAITPVPGGVGVMTVTSLMQNTLKAAQKAYYS